MPNSDWISGLWPGGEMTFHAQLDPNDDKISRRSYTAISPCNLKGIVVFLVKVFRVDKNDNGFAFSYFLETKLNIGESILCSGPSGNLRYSGYGNFVINGQEAKHKERVLFFAGGSGICQIFSIIQASISSQDGMEIWLIYSSKSKRDILFEDMFQALQEMSPTFKLYHTLTQYDPQVDEKWSGYQGRINKHMFKNIKALGVPGPDPDVITVQCGPPGFKESIQSFLLQEGYKKGVHMF